jgi:VanZ family protein
MRALPATRPWSSATVLATVYAALVLYASLYPFEGWRWPPGQSLAALLVLPQSRYHTDFDLYSNLLGYLPLGLLVAIAARRSGVRGRSAWSVSAGLGVALSYFCEVTQHLVPGRVPSLEDWAMNSAGVSLGALLALLLHRSGWVDRWQDFRQRWFAGDDAIALALLVLWPVALLFPTPVPLGLGQVVERLREAGAAGLANVPWAETVQALLAAPPAAITTLRPLAEVLLIALGLLAPCLVAYSVAAAGWRRLALALGVLAAGCASMALSTLLNFGPRHALAWVTPQAAQGLALGLLLALLALPLRRRMAAGVGLVVLTGLVLGVAQAGDDPYFAASLHAWEQGRFVRFHGLAQWVGWLWPYAAMLWLLSRLGSADRPRAGDP